MKRFPAGFVWGTAASSYQIEGSTKVDGRSESIWDRFAATPGKIVDGTNGAVACDHYNRFKQDVQLMSWLGVHAYRLSVAWPRILPNGGGNRPNERGLDFYERLVDALLARGIRPFITLYHWDLPQVLEDRGGWPVRGTAEAFVDYAHAVTARLGDRVKDWITHNEPWCASVLGYATGIHAPGRKDWPAALASAHHLLLSHGFAMDVIRNNVKDARAGITLNLTPAYPASKSAVDQDASRAFDGSFNRWFLDPLFGRGYPEDVIADFTREGKLDGSGLPFVRTGDLDVIARPMDFLGVNYYSRAVLRASDVAEADNAPPEHKVSDDRTDMGWEVYPDGLCDLLVRLHRDYPPLPLYVTENGAAYPDVPDEHGQIADAARVRYLQSHLSACADACARGVPLAGYFVWSLLDNFEWAEGYLKRFGIVWVDYQTLERIPKQSAHWYRSAVAENAVVGQSYACPCP